MNLKYYLQKFENLHVDKSKHKTMGGDAPHKPILLISIIHLIEQGLIQTEKIYLTPELFAKFKENWDLLVTTKHTCQLFNPFFHLKNEGFWQLVAHEKYDSILKSSESISSLNKLNEIVAYAQLDKELFILLSDENSRVELKHCLLTCYFRDTMQIYLANKKHD